MDNKITICIDMDNTIFPLIETICERYNEIYNDTIDKNTFKEYDISPHIKCTPEEFFRIADEEIFTSMKPYEGCKEYLDLIHNNNELDVYFLTAGFPESIKNRNILLKKTFDWYTPDRLIVCQNKHLIDCDVMIDDCIDNLLKADHPILRILVDMPWNRDEEERKEIQAVVTSWSDIYQKALDIRGIQ